MQDFFANIDGRIFEYNFAEMLNLDYLFAVDPGKTELQSWFYLLSFIFLILVFVGRFVLNRIEIDGVYKVLIKVFLKRSFWAGLVLLVLAFARGQGIRYLDMRIWVLLVFVFELGNLFYLTYQLVKKEPKKKEEIKRVTDYQKYLPKKKKNV